MQGAPTTVLGPQSPVSRLARCLGAQAPFVALLPLPSEWGTWCGPRLCPTWNPALSPATQGRCNGLGSALLAAAAAVTLLFNWPVSIGEEDRCGS